MSIKRIITSWIFRLSPLSISSLEGYRSDVDVHQKIVGVTDLIAALAGPREAEEDFNKRHTMSHPPEHIPDMEHIDEKAKPVKEPKKKEEKLKEKVIN